MNDSLLDRVQGRITSANKTIAATVLILLVTWNTGIEPMYAKLKAILEGRAAYAKVQQTRDTYTRLYQKLTKEKPDGSSVRLNGRNLGQIDLQHSISAVKNQEIQLTSELRELRRKAQLPLKLYGLEFFVRPVYAPLLWLLGAAAIIAFITASRREIFNLACRHILQSRGSNSAPPAPLEDHPWWLHPFPRRAGTRVTCEELRALA